MTAIPPRAPVHLQPRPKAPATSNLAATAATASKEPITPNPRTTPRPLSSDPLSDKATIVFIRRTLCPFPTAKQNASARGAPTPPPIEALLPPLTSQNDIDLQLYAIVAVIIKEFVLTWYAKITPDQVFVEEVVKIIAHCTRALEQRLRKVDLEALLFDELPELLDAHIIGMFVTQHSCHTIDRQAWLMEHHSIPNITQSFTPFTNEM